MAGSKIDMTLLAFIKKDLVTFDSAFLRTLLLNQPTVKLEVELLSDNKNYTFEIDKNTKQIIQEMAWLTINYDILKDSLLKIPTG
jgi:hypothetical protein